MQPPWQRLRLNQGRLVKKIVRRGVGVRILFFAGKQHLMRAGLKDHHGNLFFALAHKPGELFKINAGRGE